jgi:hypothetical protein
MTNLRSNHSRLGFALQLCAVRFLGCFLSNLAQTPSVVVDYLAQQLEMPDLQGWDLYAVSNMGLRSFIKVRVPLLCCATYMLVLG